MAVSRRTLLGTALAASAAVALPGKAFAQAAGTPGDVVGKVTVGYQGWFACPGDGAPINGWWHWSNDWSQPPSPSNKSLISWPDMSEYTAKYQTAFGPLGSGAPATLFSSYNQQTVDTHFRWLRENNIDTAALQRFNPFGGEGPTRDDMAARVRSAAETNGRKFYIMYDATGWASMQSEMKTDWTTKMAAHTASSAYAHQNGKPVVCIWGFGYNDNNHPWDAATCLDVVNWFKSQGCYVIGGVPREWRSGTGGSRPGFADVYHGFDMLSPWMVGAIGNVGDSDWMYENMNVPDVADCAAHGIDYQPCVLPGDVSGRQRVHGDFMWRQFYNMIRAGAQGIYISMFDEYNEGNQIAKTAATPADAPTGFLTLDEDGTACSSDYYLRLTGDGGRMLKGEIALTSVRPTSPTTGTTPSGDRAAGRPTSQSSQTEVYGAANVVDGNPQTYWESRNNAFPQWVQVDLGAAVAVRRVELTLPPSWAARTQTVSIVDGSTVLVPPADYRFDPASGNTVVVTAPGTAVRYLRVLVTANTGWPAGQLSGLRVYS